MVKRQMR